MNTMMYTAEYSIDGGPAREERAGNYQELFRAVQRRVAEEAREDAYMVIRLDDGVVKYAAEWWKGRKTWSKIIRLIGRKYKPQSEQR